jgi:hypothetical protein
MVPKEGKRSKFTPSTQMNGAEADRLDTGRYGRPNIGVMAPRLQTTPKLSGSTCQRYIHQIVVHNYIISLHPPHGWTLRVQNLFQTNQSSCLPQQPATRISRTGRFHFNRQYFQLQSKAVKKNINSSLDQRRERMVAGRRTKGTFPVKADSYHLNRYHRTSLSSKEK